MGVRTESTPQEPPLPCGVGRELATERQTKGMRPPARSTTDVPRPGGCSKPGQTRARNPGSQTGLKQWQRNLLHSGCQLGNRCVNRVEFLLRLQRRVLPARLALAAPGATWPWSLPRPDTAVLPRVFTASPAASGPGWCPVLHRRSPLPMALSHLLASTPGVTSSWNPHLQNLSWDVLGSDQLS